MPTRSCRIAVFVLGCAAAAVIRGEADDSPFPQAPVAVEIHGAVTPSSPAVGAAITFGGIFSVGAEGEWQFREESWGGGIHAPRIQDRFVMVMARLNVLPTRPVSPFLHVGVAWNQWRWDSGVTPPPPPWDEYGPHLREHESGTGTGSGPLVGIGVDIRVVPRLAIFAELRAALLMSNGELVLSGPGALRLGVRLRLPR